MKNIKGFTLAEILVVAVLIFILIAALIGALNTTFSIFLFTDITAELNSESRLAIRLMSEELRNTSQGEIVITQDYPVVGTDRIVYSLLPLVGGVPPIIGGEPDWSSAVSVTISLDDTTNELIRTDDTPQTSVIAEYVKRVNFIDRSIDASLYLDELRIILELERSDARGKLYNAVSTMTVNMRN